MELHWIISGERHTQALVQELSKGVLGVLQEEAVVTEGGHGDGHLCQVVQVLQHRALWADTHPKWLSV